MTTQKNSEEAALQYNAQVDVIEQLAAKVDQQLSTQKRVEKNPTIKTALIKLERDFDAVKKRVASLQESVAKIRKQSAALRQQQAAAGVLNDPNKNAQENMGYEEFQRHMELQLQQDVSVHEDKRVIFAFALALSCRKTDVRGLRLDFVPFFLQRLAEQIMREREDEIRKINQGMHQVNEIYKDLAHIVGSQQEHVDAIETQMEESRANAEAGLQQVEKANQQFGSSQCIIS